MFGVLATRPDFPEKAISLIKTVCDVDIWPESTPISKEELLKRVEGKDALFCVLTDKIDEEILNAAGPQLKVIGTMSVGYDHLCLEEIKKRGIKVGYTPDILTNATAELTVALLLATSRRLFEAHSEIKSGGWSEHVWGPVWMTGKTLAGSTVGIFGFGRIGQAVAKRLQGFDVGRYLYCSHTQKKEGDELGAHFVSFDQLLKESDFVIITASLNEETKEIFDEKAFSKMKSSAILINTSRGGLVNQDALINALKSNQILAAGLDVMTPEPLPPDHGLLTLRNCTIIPHIGSAEESTRENMAILTAENIIAALQGKPMPARLC